MSTTEDLLQRNSRYAESFGDGGLPAPPAGGVAVLTCMDARLHPERLLGLQFGEAHVIRNAGGRASDDALRSLIVSSRLLGTTEFLVIHHTRCGMLGLSDEDLRDRLAADTGADASHIEFLGFGDLEDSVRDDVRRIRRSPFIPAEATISGYVYDVDSGRLTPVEDAVA